MRVLVIGTTGTIGRAVGDLLGGHHEVVPVSRRGPLRADLTDPASIDAMFAETGRVDAVVCCAANAPMARLDDPDYWTGLDGKLLGQVNLVRQAVPHVRDGGSITLTSGRFAEPVPGTSLGHLVNAGLEAFVRAAATELPRGLRLNVVSPGWVRETLQNLDMDPQQGTPAADVARLYASAVEGAAQGHIFT
ncbi:short chain dehydrogenase [Actinomadura sp. NPDC047616]|uniref:short chain dehydrogenase n=1 Tax=Actinomadura sp. NPDC047616 TaxID=3155914 RepID=UPI00340D699B